MYIIYIYIYKSSIAHTAYSASIFRRVYNLNSSWIKCISSRRKAMLMVSSYIPQCIRSPPAVQYFMSEFYGQILHNVIYYTIDRNLIVDRIIEVLFLFRQTLRVVKIFIVFYLY